jgi:hypothetical protein
MSALKFTGWLPIGVSPKAWEGKLVFWRDGESGNVTLQQIPDGFSRLAHHCGSIQVAGIEGGAHPANALFDLLTEQKRQIDELIEALEKARSVLDRTSIGENTMELRDDAYLAGANISSVLARTRRG